MALSRREFLKYCGLGMVTVAASGLVGCGGSGGDAGSAAAGGSVANADKPVVFYNRQPSNSSTGELDMTTLNWNKDTYYVGFDAKQGGELEALGTAVEKDGQIVSDPVGTNTDGKSDKVKDGEIEVDGKKFIVRELASQEMKTSAGATWDAATAGNALSGTWASAFGDQIDVVVSNNDGMGMSMYSNWAKENKVPVFGYDANSDAVAALGDSEFPYGGTISQNPAVQAYLTLRLLRNALDGVDVNTGVGEADAAGNVIAEEDFKYSEDDRSFYAMNLEVTAENYKDFTDPANTLYETAQTQLDEGDSPKKKVWLSIYNSADNFLGSTYKPLLEKYAPLLNLDLEIVQGDGQNESSITNKLANPADFDAFAINMVKTDNGASYTSNLG